MRVVHGRKPAVSSAVDKVIVNIAFSHDPAASMKFDARSSIRIIPPLFAWPAGPNKDVLASVRCATISGIVQPDSVSRPA